MLSELIEGAKEQFDLCGDMPVLIDHAKLKYEYAAVEMRREVDPESTTSKFVIADYLYVRPRLKVVKN